MTALPTAAQWAERARAAREDGKDFLTAAYVCADTVPLDIRHGVYTGALYRAEMDKADAAREWARWCDECAGSALADEQHQGEAS